MKWEWYKMLLIKEKKAWIWYKSLSFEGHPGMKDQQGVETVGLDKGGNSWLKEVLKNLVNRTFSNNTHFGSPKASEMPPYYQVFSIYLG